MTTTPHSEFEDALSAYALGVLEITERRAFEAHLPTCISCQTELIKIRRAIAGIGLSIEPVAPPEALKARVLAHAMAQPQRGATGAGLPARPFVTRERPLGASRSLSTSALALAASLALAVAAGIYALSLRSQVNSLRQTVAQTSAQAESLRAEVVAARRDAATLIRVFRVLSAPDLVQVSLKGQATAPDATARGLWAKSQGLVFNVQGLPALDVSKVYQLWVIRGSQVESAGVFTVDASGTGSLALAPTTAIEPPEALAVSLEQAPGVPERKGPIVLLGSSQK